jgi:hypothetical protein
VLPQIVTVNPFMSTRRRRRRVKNPYRAHRRHRNPESRAERRRAARKGHRRHHYRMHNRFRHRRHRVHNPFKFRHRRRHNPDAMVADLTNDLVAAAIGAGSAVALDVALAYAPIPAAWSTGWGQVLVQGAGSVVLGMLAGMVTDKRTASLVTIGGLTVTGYGALQLALGPTLGQNIKGFGGLADFSDFRGGRVGAYMANPQASLPAPMPAGKRVGAYMPGARLAPGGSLQAMQMGAYMRSKSMGAFNGFGGLQPGNF